MIIMIQEKVNFGGWPNCLRLANGKIELIITTDVGPRIIKLGFTGGRNLMFVSPEDQGRTGGDQWRIYGGHRLWHAPEVMPRTYFPDNFPVKYSWDGKMLKLMQDKENTTGISKEIEITMDPGRDQIRILHRLVNHNLWDIEISAWAITALAPGGKAVLPHEPYIDPALHLLPSRPVVLWHYTEMKDPRWIWGNRYIQLLQDPVRRSEQKIGILNKQGWAAFILGEDVFIKSVSFDPEAQYPDYGSNNEIYTNGDLLEVETLGPVKKLAPGKSLKHTEKWKLAKLTSEFKDNEESSIDSLLMPLVHSFLDKDS